MTREDLAKDILLTLLLNWARDIEPSYPDPIQRLSETSVALADALLEALGAKEAPASWLSKEMRTPAKGFPAIKGAWVPKVGEVVRVKDGLPLPRGLYSGHTGKVASVEDGEVQVAFEVSWLYFMAYDLEPAE